MNLTNPRAHRNLRPLGSFLALAVGCALLAVLLPGCDGGGSSERKTSDHPNAEAEFVFASRGKVVTLDPGQMSWQQDIRIAQQLFEGIYSLDPETLEPILGAAEQVTHNDDYTQYTITLKPEARWSNGDPVTVDDFIFAWRRMMQQPGYYSYLVVDYLKGAQAYTATYQADARSADFSTVGVQKVDDRTMRVELEYPTPFFPDLLAFPCYYPLHRKSMEEFRRFDEETGRERYESSFAAPGVLVSNGPYRLTRWDQNTGQTLEMNEHYWDKDSVKSRTVRALDSEDFNLAFERYREGLIDWISEAPGLNAYEMRRAGRDDIHVFPAYGTYFWTFNTSAKLPDGRDNPLADVRVRRALSAAIDKQEIVNTITRNDEMPTEVFVPKNKEYFPGYPHPTGAAYDVDEAGRLLAEAGYPKGEGFPRVSLLYDTDNPVHGMVAQNLARQWREKLGVSFDLNGMEHQQFRETYKPKMQELPDGTRQLKSGNFAISRGSWYGDYLDVTTFLDMFTPLSLNNSAVWINQEYASLMEQARRTGDPQERLKILARAEQLFLDEAPIMPLYHYTNRYVHRADVTGISRSPRNMVVVKNVQTPRSTGPGINKTGDAPSTRPADQTAAAR